MFSIIKIIRKNDTAYADYHDDQQRYFHFLIHLLDYKDKQITGRGEKYGESKNRSYNSITADGNSNH